MRALNQAEVLAVSGGNTVGAIGAVFGGVVGAAAGLYVVSPILYVGGIFALAAGSGVVTEAFPILAGYLLAGVGIGATSGACIGGVTGQAIGYIAENIAAA
ncbi:MAG: hypothetical protein JSR17_13395 [Proteobacteria bacterium]|nr:hypothetical protein [Pseudomonadota bacterium]